MLREDREARRPFKGRTSDKSLNDENEAALEIEGSLRPIEQEVQIL